MKESTTAPNTFYKDSVQKSEPDWDFFYEKEGQCVQKPEPDWDFFNEKEGSVQKPEPDWDFPIQFPHFYFINLLSMSKSI